MKTLKQMYVDKWKEYLEDSTGAVVVSQSQLIPVSNPRSDKEPWAKQIGSFLKLLRLGCLGSLRRTPRLEWQVFPQATAMWDIIQWVCSPFTLLVERFIETLVLLKSLPLMQGGLRHCSTHAPHVTGVPCTPRPQCEDVMADNPRRSCTWHSAAARTRASPWSDDPSNTSALSGFCF